MTRNERRDSRVPNRLRQLLNRPGAVRAVGAHDAISARIGERHGFDAVWASGLGISTANAMPDIGLLTMTEMLDAARRMRTATALPIIAGCDAGAEDRTVMRRLIREYEVAGISAVCIEGKRYPKRNSFREGQELRPAKEFAARVAHSKQSQHTDGFVVIARIESLIAGIGIPDALDRALLYRDAGGGCATRPFQG